MKRKTTLLLYFLITINSFCQDNKSKFEWGVFFQSHLSETNRTSSSYEKYYPRYGYQVGIQSYYSFTSKQYLCVGISYHNYGYSTSRILNNTIYPYPLTQYNTYSKYCIIMPTFYGLKIINKEKIDLSLYAGFFTGILYLENAEAKIQHGDTIISSQDVKFDQNMHLNLSLLIGLDFSYKINDKISIFIQPIYNTYLTSIRFFKAIHYCDYGSKIGIKYRFNKK